MSKGLTVRELLKDTYYKMSEKCSSQRIFLPKRTLVEIADDSDWHRTRTGYMGYESADLFQLGGKTWAITVGEKCGDYPAERYDSDIMALEIITEGKTSKQIQEELIEKIQNSPYFENSLIFGGNDGNLGISQNSRFGMIMLELLKPEIKKFIAQKAKYDTSVISASTLQHPVKKPILYKTKLVDFLSEAIKIVLKKSGGKEK